MVLEREQWREDKGVVMNGEADEGGDGMELKTGLFVTASTF